MTQNLKRGLLAVSLLGSALAANAQSTLPDASTQIAAITTSLGGYATVMFALALAQATEPRTAPAATKRRPSTPKSCVTAPT